MNEIEFLCERDPAGYHIELAGLTLVEAETIMMHVANMVDRRSGGPRTPSEWSKIATVDRD